MKVFMVYDKNDVDSNDENSLAFFSPSFFSTMDEVKEYLKDEYNMGEEVGEWKVLEVDLSKGSWVKMELSCSIIPPFRE